MSTIENVSEYTILFKAVKLFQKILKKPGEIPNFKGTASTVNSQGHGTTQSGSRLGPPLLLSGSAVVPGYVQRSIITLYIYLNNKFVPQCTNQLMY